MLELSPLDMYRNIGRSLNPFKKRRKLFYLKSQFVPRSKHFNVGYKKTNHIFYLRN